MFFVGVVIDCIIDGWLGMFRFWLGVFELKLDWGMFGAMGDWLLRRVGCWLSGDLGWTGLLLRFLLGLEVLPDVQPIVSFINLLFNIQIWKSNQCNYSLSKSYLSVFAFISLQNISMLHNKYLQIAVCVKIVLMYQDSNLTKINYSASSLVSFHFICSFHSFIAPVPCMIPELNQKQILEQATQLVQSAMNECTNQILASLENSFNSLAAFRSKRQNQKDQIIIEQKQTIQRLKKLEQLFSIVNKQYASLTNLPQSQSQSHPSQPNQPLEPQPNPINQSLPELYVKESLVTGGSRGKRKVQLEKESKSISKQKIQQVQIQSQKHTKEKTQRKDYTRGINPPTRKAQYKSPLQCRASHPLLQVAYTPNLTRLNFIQYNHKNSIPFDQKDVQLLEKYDLNDVTSIALTLTELSNSALSAFTRLDLANLRSLRIQNNKITDLRPLAKLNLSIFQDLDVSNNPLTVESAQFLAMESFDELIYFTVSFDTGLDDECWKCLLDNQMKNYPKLQALDVCNENQLSPQTKKQIRNCMLRKTVNQKLISRQQGFPDYPSDYEIKITWNESPQIFETYSQEKQLEIAGRWQRSVNYDYKKLPRLSARYLRREFESRISGKKQKRRGIKKIRRNRGSLQRRIQQVKAQSSEEQRMDQEENSDSEADQ